VDTRAQVTAEPHGSQEFSASVLRLDAAHETERIASVLQESILRTMKRRGAVLGFSGGIDSSVSAALCVRALGPERVVGLLMPEIDSASDTTELGQLVARTLGVRTIVEHIAPILEIAGCYSRRDHAIRQVIPEYGPGYRSKIVLPNALDADGYNVFSVVAESPTGEQIRTRLTLDAYLGILAATNFKQRVRKMMEYHYADRFQYAVVGTPNRLEYDQGFFVKLGDGAADVKPIAHLYKTQVYQLAEYLGIPEDIRRRPPTTDTYSLPQSQEEFYFSLPYEKLDLCLYGLNHGVPAAAVGPAVGLTTQQVERVYRDIASKRRATRYLHMPPVLVNEALTERASEADSQ
jgi:NAD+ synthase